MTKSYQTLVSAAVIGLLTSIILGCDSGGGDTAPSAPTPTPAADLGLGVVTNVSLAPAATKDYKFSTVESVKHPIYIYAANSDAIKFSFTGGGDTLISHCSILTAVPTRQICNIHPYGEATDPVANTTYTFKLTNQGMVDQDFRLIVFQDAATVGTTDSPATLALDTPTDGVVASELIETDASYYNLITDTAGSHTLTIDSTDSISVRVYDDMAFTNQVGQCISPPGNNGLRQELACPINLNAFSNYYLKVSPLDSRIAYTLTVQSPQ